MTTYAQRELEGKAGNAFSQFQQYLDEKLGTHRTEMENLVNSSKLDGESKATIIAMQNDLNNMTSEIKRMQIAASAPRVDESKSNDAAHIERKQAMNIALRHGYGALKPEQRKYIALDIESGIQTKAMYAADATTGGFLAVPEFVEDLLKNIVEISPMSDLVDMRMTSKPWVMTPKRTQTASAVRVAEQATRTETQNPRFGMLQNFPYESYAFTLISRTDLDDSELDLAAFIQSEFSEQFAKLQGYEYINGLGSASSQSFGFLNDTTIAQTTTAAQGVIDYASLVKLKQSLKIPYVGNATWIFTRETLGVIQSLTDTQGRPLWQPFGGVLPETLFGRPYRIMEDMPQVANSALAVGYGDFKNGYQGVVRKQMSMQVLNERYADQNAVGYFGYLRFGGTTKISEAIKILKIHP